MKTFPEEYRDKLGKMPDAHLAKLIGVSPTFIKARRLEAGIPVFKKRDKLTQKDKELLVSLLGKVRDAVLARRFGITRERVRQIRESLGIPKFTSKVKVKTISH